MMKLKVSLTAILSTSAIASGILLGSVNAAQACSHSKSDYLAGTIRASKLVKHSLSCASYDTRNCDRNSTICRTSPLQQTKLSRGN
jgi:hypothetical protein